MRALAAAKKAGAIHKATLAENVAVITSLTHCVGQAVARYAAESHRHPCFQHVAHDGSGRSAVGRTGGNQGTIAVGRHQGCSRMELLADQSGAPDDADSPVFTRCRALPESVAVSLYTVASLWR